MKLLMFVSGASSKDVPCKGETLRARFYAHFTCAILCASMFLQTDKTVVTTMLAG